MSGLRATDRTLRLNVRSSAGRACHEVIAERTAGGLRLTCSCRSARAGCFCEHRLRLLLGDNAALAGDSEPLHGLSAWLRDLPVAKAAQELSRLRRERLLIADEIKRQERYLADLMAG